MSRLLFAALVVALAHPAHADFKLRLSYPAVVGTWTQGANLNGADSTNSRFMQYVPNDASTTNWQHWAGSFANGGGQCGRRNQVMRFGWNIAGGGGRAITGANNGALADEFEQCYDGYAAVMERHMSYVDPADTTTRFLSFDGRLTTPYTTRLYLTAKEISLGRGTSPSDNDGSLIINATETQVRGPNGYNRIRFDNTNGVNIEGGTTNTPAGKIIVDTAGDIYAQGRDAYIGPSGVWNLRATSNGGFVQSNDGTYILQAHDTGMYLLHNSDQLLRAWNDEVRIAVGASTIKAQVGGDVQVTSTRGYLGGVSTGVRFDWTATAADIFSPDANTNLYVANGDMQFIVGGTQSLRLTSSVATVRVPIWPNVADSYDVGVEGQEMKIGYFTRGVELGSTIGNRPACSATTDGRVYYVKQTSSTRGTLYMCIGSDAAVYNWVSIANGGA